MTWLKLLFQSFALALVAAVSAILLVSVRDGMLSRELEQIAEAARRNDSQVLHGDSLQLIDSSRDGRGFLNHYREVLGCSAPNQHRVGGVIGSLTSNEGGTERRSKIPSTVRSGWTQHTYPANVSDELNHPELARAESNDFLLSVRGENAMLPVHLEEDLRLGAQIHFDLWRDWLGDEALVRTHINVRFLGEANHFDAVFGKQSQRWRATGFYRLRSNEAVVLYAPSFKAGALATAFHEISHLITAWHLGPISPWLNEGLAEYFETLEIEDGNARFTTSRHHMKVLAEQGTVPLKTLTELSPIQWGERDAHRRYATAWVLIAYLQHTDSGRKVLADIVRSAYGQRCDGLVTPTAALIGDEQRDLQTLDQQLREWIKAQTVFQGRRLEKSF
ncbi:MAG: hypothetical protein AAGC91_09245 [Pseudomonadota bacterium]